MVRAKVLMNFRSWRRNQIVTLSDTEEALRLTEASVIEIIEDVDPAYDDEDLGEVDLIEDLPVADDGDPADDDGLGDDDGAEADDEDEPPSEDSYQPPEFHSPLGH